MTSRANYDGLTRLQVAGTWSPQPSTFPIVLDKEIRGGLRYCSGADNDTLTNIPGAMLQEGMLVYLENTTGTFTGENYYQYRLLDGESRNTTSGAMPNANANWTRWAGGNSGGALDVTGVADVDALNALADTLDADNDGDLVQLLDSTDFNDTAETDPDITGIPDPLPFTPGPGIAVIVRWNQEGTIAGSWQYQRFARNNPDTAYVLEDGDTMNGTLFIDNTTADENALVTGAGHDIVLGNGANIVFDGANGDGTFGTAALTANRTYTLPDSDGTLATTNDVATVAGWQLDTTADPDTITAQGTAATIIIPSGNITTTGNDNIDLDPAGTGTVIFGANATAEADLTVNGNTTLGNANTDTVTVAGSLTCNENVTLNNATTETTTINGVLNFDIGLLTEV